MRIRIESNQTNNRRCERVKEVFGKGVDEIIIVEKKP